ncbi:MAG: rod shape-determining protein RodA [Candidatus Omnitrophota bacterium]
MIWRDIRKLDTIILLCVACIFSIGLLFLYSAVHSFPEDYSRSIVTKQMIWMALGMLIALIFIILDYRKFVDMAYVFYGISVLALIFVLFAGERRLGAQRWIQIGAFGFQPSEAIKIAFILAMSSFIGRRKDDISNPVNIVGAMLLLGVPFVLIAAQPDLGTALVLIPVFIALLYIGGMSVKPLMAFIACGIMGTPLFWHMLKDYQRKRLLVFVNPDLDPMGAGYTIIQSKIAIGSGRIMGKGWLSGTQGQLNFLPERHTDFIFSVVGEEWGLVGGLVLLSLYFVVIYRGIRIIGMTSDMYGKLIATGAVSLLAFQVIVNIGMTLGLLPVVGLTLPFISYGGSSLISSAVAVALLLNVGLRRPLF